MLLASFNVFDPELEIVLAKRCRTDYKVRRILSDKSRVFLRFFTIRRKSLRFFDDRILLGRELTVNDETTMDDQGRPKNLQIFLFCYRFLLSSIDDLEIVAKKKVMSQSRTKSPTCM